MSVRDEPMQVIVDSDSIRVVSAGTMGPASLGIGDMVLGTEGQVVTVVGGVPVFADAPTGGMSWGFFDVTDYGAVFDADLAAGTGTNNRTAVNDAIAAAETAIDAGTIDGATIFFRDGPIRIEHTGASAGPQSMYIACPITRDNITIQLSPNTVIMLRTGNAAGVQIFGAHGWSRPSGPADWQDHWVAYTGSVTAHPVYAMSSVAKGATTITLTTAGNAANFAAGDAIHIRSGQTIAIQGTTANEPDAELNEIVSANAGTGVLTLKYPTRKAYVQEYFASSPGSGVGPTTTSSSAYPALFGVQNIESAVLRNIKVLGGRFDLQPATGYAYAFYPVQVMGWEAGNWTANLVNASMQNGGTHQGGSLHDVTETHANTISTGTVLATNTGCSDFLFKNLKYEGITPIPTIAHIHEGTANVTLDNVTITNQIGTSTNHAIQLLARWYDVRIVKPTIHYPQTNGNAIFASSDGAGLLLDSPQITAGYPNLAGANVELINVPGFVQANGQVTDTVKSVAKWVYYDSASSIVLATLPGRCYVLSTEIYLWTKFTGGTSPTIAVGDAVWGQSYVNTISLNPGAGTRQLLAVVREPTEAHYRAQSAPFDVTITYTRDGATAGRALVVMTYVHVEMGAGI
jgi:hypothetical protein